MERLTSITTDGWIRYNGRDYHPEEPDAFGIVKLYEYEDAEEQGRIVVLPIKNKSGSAFVDCAKNCHKAAKCFNENWGIMRQITSEKCFEYRNGMKRSAE